MGISWTLSVEGTGKYASTVRKCKRKRKTWDSQNRESYVVIQQDCSITYPEGTGQTLIIFIYFFRKDHWLGHSPLETQIFCGHLSNKDHEKDNNEK